MGGVVCRRERGNLYSAGNPEAAQARLMDKHRAPDRECGDRRFHALLRFPRKEQELMPHSLLKDLRATAELLERIAADWRLLDHLPAEERRRFHDAIARLYNPDPVVRRRRMKAEERARKAAGTQREEAVLNRTGIRELRRKPVYMTPNVFPPTEIAEEHIESLEPQHCYVCKQKYSEIHHFYDQLCPSCAELNFRKRTELADLTGRVALLTGGRVEIGYQAGLKLLRAGAPLIVTTRLPPESAGRRAEEA